MVFRVGIGLNRQPAQDTPPVRYGPSGGPVGNQLVPPLPQSPKFLSNFKLSKFDGSARNWKAWNKSFTRYLAIHQLDYVLELEFLELLPHSRDAFTANKMVYYILEDAIVP